METAWNCRGLLGALVFRIVVWNGYMLRQIPGIAPYISRIATISSSPWLESDSFCIGLGCAMLKKIHINGSRHGYNLFHVQAEICT